MSPSTERVRHVLFMPDYRAGNPYQGLLANALEGQGLRVRFAMSPGRLPFLKAVRAGPPADVLHLHWHHGYVMRRSWWFTAAKAIRGLADLTLVRGLGVPLVWTVHNTLEHERRQPGIELIFSRMLARMADRIVVHSESARRDVITAFRIPPSRRARVSVLLHGNYDGAYPDDVDRAAAREILGLAPDDTVFLSIGSIRAYKGLGKLLAAFRGLRDPSARLVVAGRPKSEEVAAKVRELAAGDPRIRLDLDFIEDARLQIYFRAADAVVLPYERLLTSGLLLLAMTFGKAVIAPRLGFFRDMLDDRGAVFYDDVSLAGLRRTLRLAPSADFEAMGRWNRALAERLDWGRIAEGTRKVYEDAAARRARARRGPRSEPSGARIAREAGRDGGRG